MWRTVEPDAISRTLANRPGVHDSCLTMGMEKATQENDKLKLENDSQHIHNSSESPCDVGAKIVVTSSNL